MSIQLKTDHNYKANRSVHSTATIANKADNFKIKIYIESLGCFKNQYDSEVMLSQLIASGFSITSDPALADVLLINTCAFLSSAVYESIERILVLSNYKDRAKDLSPSKNSPKLIVAGCLVQRYKDELTQKIPLIDAMLGTSDYRQILPLIQEILNRSELNKQGLLGLNNTNFAKRPRYIWENFETPSVSINHNHFRFLKIAEGCSNACSFCNIPKLRGKQSSRPPTQIISEFKRFLQSGVKEINMIAQNSTAYGFDLKLGKDCNLAGLTKNLLSTANKLKHTDYWLRIFYSYPNNYPLELLEMMLEHPSLVPYIDMPLQHINNSILKRMNRRITKSEIFNLLDKMLNLKSDLALRSTFIVGFPGESEEDFKELHDFLAKGYFTHVGVFTYFAEDNIYSNRYLDDVPLKVKKERQKILMTLQKNLCQKKNHSLVGSIVKVLIDKVISIKDGQKLFSARTSGQAFEVDGQVKIQSNSLEIGKFYQVRVMEAKGFDLFATVL